MCVSDEARETEHSSRTERIPFLVRYEAFWCEAKSFTWLWQTLHTHLNERRHRQQNTVDTSHTHTHNKYTNLSTQACSSVWPVVALRVGSVLQADEDWVSDTPQKLQQCVSVVTLSELLLSDRLWFVLNETKLSFHCRHTVMWFLVMLLYLRLMTETCYENVYYVAHNANMPLFGKYNVYNVHCLSSTCWHANIC